MFKVGAKVRCVDAKDTRLLVDNIYTVKEVDTNKDSVTVVSDNGIIYAGYLPSRFVMAGPPQFKVRLHLQYSLK